MTTTYRYSAIVTDDGIVISCWKEYEDNCIFGSGGGDSDEQILEKLFHSFDDFYEFLHLPEHSEWKAAVLLQCDIVAHYQYELKTKIQQVEDLEYQIRLIDDELNLIVPKDNQAWDKKYKSKLKSTLTKAKNVIDRALVKRVPW